jgi:hypothetical protein
MDLHLFDTNDGCVCRFMRTLVVVLAVVMPGCANAVAPNDPAKARYTLDIMPLTAWIYQDEGLPVRVDFNCWDADGSTRMAFADGEHSIQYTIQQQDDTPIVLSRKSSPPFGQWSGDLDLARPGGHAPAIGRYRLSVTMRLPSGDIVKGGFIRDVEVRQREIEFSLTVDKAKYTVGEPIILTGMVKNISDRDLVPEELRKPEVVLRETGAGHEYRLSLDASLGEKRLTPGTERQLFQVRCKAGEADKRFGMGFTTELVPPPFQRVGRYTLECRMRVETVREVPEHRKWWLRPRMEALPRSITVDIVRPLGEKEGT